MPAAPHISSAPLTPQGLSARFDALAEPQYQAFSSALVPGGPPMRGVRLPALRALAKELLHTADWQTILDWEPQDFETAMLQGMLVSTARMPVGERREALTAFLPRITNWSICDSCCAGCKFMRADRAAWWDFLAPLLHSAQPFTVRFGVVCLLDHFLVLDWLPQVLDALAQVDHPDYYVRMAVAWAVSAAFVRSPALVREFLAEGRLQDRATHNKAIQKCRESFRVSAADKEFLRSLRR